MSQSTTNGGYNLHPNLDVDQWAARLSERNAARANSPELRNPNDGVPKRPWWKYLGWTFLFLVLVLALIMLGIYIHILHESQARHQESINISVNANKTVLHKIDVTDVTECLWILSSASSANSFPLLLSVNEKHRVVLGELSAPTLDRLVQAQADASLILKDRTPNVNNYLAQAARIFTVSEYDMVVFSSELNLASKQLGAIRSVLDSLAKHYYVVRGNYDTVYATTASVLEEIKLNNRTEFLSFSQSWGSSWFYDPYSVPRNKMSKIMDKVCFGFDALKLEITRLEQIKHLIHWLEYALLDLSTSIYGWDAECTREAQHNCIPKKVREWFQQNFVHNHQIRNTWVELLMSVKRGEQMIYLDISNEWCNGSRQASLSIESG